MTSLVPLISTLEHKALVTWVTQELHDHAFFLYQLSVRQLWPLQKHCDETKLPRPRLPSHRQKYQFWATENCIWSKCIIDTFEASSAWKLWLKNIVDPHRELFEHCWVGYEYLKRYASFKKKCIDIRICIHYTIGWPRVSSCVVDSILCWENEAALERVVSSDLYNITQNSIGWDMEIMQSKVVWMYVSGLSFGVSDLFFTWWEHILWHLNFLFWMLLG